MVPPTGPPPAHGTPPPPPPPPVGAGVGLIPLPIPPNPIPTVPILSKPTDQITTVYVGKIPPGIEDNFIRILLEVRQNWFFVLFCFVVFVYFFGLVLFLFPLFFLLFSISLDVFYSRVAVNCNRRDNFFFFFFSFLSFSLSVLSFSNHLSLLVFFGFSLFCFLFKSFFPPLQQCGKVANWRRVADPVTGKLKGFGFCDYESADGVLRALRILNNCKLDGQELLVPITNFLHTLFPFFFFVAQNPQKSTINLFARALTKFSLPFLHPPLLGLAES
jgi:hypothetical protein